MDALNGDNVVAGGAVGTAFAQSLAIKDASALRALFADEVDFRAMTPRRHWNATTPNEVIDDIVLGCWFEPQDKIIELVAVDTDSFADCDRLSYRLLLSNPDGDYLVEQQAYFTVTDGGKINWMRVICSGFRPITTR
ncbi:hypothetical protein FOE78_17040 [Microlunatus elymi]|uniref:SnoaL-like domain-containing protein n=1 Tax=Microlunatus elymi TaxID=2596828 RepID=A0A516Q1T5_9ACTN|nr:hypothetical protein [Microlunatus elymi]QDP97399.1 hypothetical protein FOE78_17040 [Microlunatus elymi]